METMTPEQQAEAEVELICSMTLPENADVRFDLFDAKPEWHPSPVPPRRHTGCILERYMLYHELWRNQCGIPHRVGPHLRLEEGEKGHLRGIVNLNDSGCAPECKSELAKLIAQRIRRNEELSDKPE